MNAKFVRLIFALVFGLSGTGFSSSAVLANPPAKDTYTFSGTITVTTLCPFSVDISSDIKLTEIVFFDENGDVPRVNQFWTIQDTFTANGKALVGFPFTYYTQMLLSDGNIVSMVSSGITEKVPLPDGSLFIGAGRTDWALHEGAGFVLLPDRGVQGNVDALCAALAP